MNYQTNCVVKIIIFRYFDIFFRITFLFSSYLFILYLFCGRLFQVRTLGTERTRRVLFFLVQMALVWDM